jgi:hypothetical protein
MEVEIAKVYDFTDDPCRTGGRQRRVHSYKVTTI